MREMLVFGHTFQTWNTIGGPFFQCKVALVAFFGCVKKVSYETNSARAKNADDHIVLYAVPALETCNASILSHVGAKKSVPISQS